MSVGAAVRNVALLMRGVLPSAGFHGVLIALGTAFLLLDAFHGNVWFDESYSVALASHSFSEIWRIDSGDVHPPLFYWALHVLYLVFGQNVLVYRLFAVAGSVCMALLGLTCLRRDFGWRVGLSFSFLALFTPYVADMAVEIRMYTWAAFCVTACCVFAWRIAHAVAVDGVGSQACAGASAPTGDGASLVGVCDSDSRALKKRCAWAGVPACWWLAFFAASLGSAYLHYFGAMAAFVVNVLLLGFLLVCAFRGRKARSLKRALASCGVLLAGACVQVALYVPWLVVLASQLGVVSGTYWANLVYPTSYVELATYPVVTSQVSFALRGESGAVCQVVLWALAAAGAIFVVAALVHAAWHRARSLGVSPSSPSGLGDALKPSAISPVACAAIASLVVYVAVLVIAWTASKVMGSNILYYRYMFVAIGPLLFAVSVALSHVRSRVLVCGVCASLLGISLVSQALNVADDYSEANDGPITALERTVGDLSGQREAAGQEGDALVVSSDIGVQGVAAVELPQISEVYMDWQSGNWGTAYEAYAPTLTSKKSWEDILEGYEGRFVVIAQAASDQQPRSVSDLSQKEGISLVESATYYRPYERTWFTIAVMEKS